MGFEHERQIVMLSGTLLGGDDVSARFRIDDAVAPRELRRFVRLNCTLPILVTPLTDDGSEAGPPETMQTVDISAGGVLLDRKDLSGAVRVELDLPGGHGTVTASGRIVRNVSDGSGVELRRHRRRDPADAGRLRPRRAPPARAALRARPSRLASSGAVAATISAMTSRRSWLAS